MEREALAELEKRVATMRVVAAEKAVLARSLSYGDPPRFHAEVSTALLAFVVFAIFLVGRGAGMFMAKGASCRALAPGQYAWVKMNDNGVEVIADTKGNLWKRGRWDKHVPPGAVRAIVDQLVKGCFLEMVPPEVHDDVEWTIIELDAGPRWARFTHRRGKPQMLCGGDVDLEDIERGIKNLSGPD